MGVTLSLNIIMLVCMYPVVFILYFALTFSAKSSGKTLFGVRYSSDWLPEEEVRALEKDFSRRNTKCLLMLMVIPFASFLSPYMSISITIWCTWLLAAIMAFSMQCARGYKHLLGLKQERCRPSGAPETVYVELKGTRIRCVKWYDLLAPVLLSFLVAAFPFLFLQGEKQETYSVFMVIIAITTLSLCACALWTDRLRVNVVSRNSDINLNYARAGKKLWKQFWMACIWTSVLYMAVVLLCLLPPFYRDDLAFPFIFWGSIASALLMMALCVYVVKRKRRLDERYYAEMDILPENDERHWIGGFIYYNPGDRHSFVDSKFGTGVTFNMARPVGKIFTAVGALALLSLPVTCIWLMLEEFTPLSLAIQDNRLEARHLAEEYSIPLDEISEVTLLTELPKNRKLRGTNSSVLEKGLFRNSDDGKVEEFLNPQNQVFLRICTDDAIYYMSSYSDEETLEIYHYLSGLTDSGP